MSAVETYGPDFGADACEEIAFTRIDKKWLKLELNLFSSKWFDYRFMHPVHATYRYAADYDRAFRQMYAANFDRRASEFYRIFKTDDIFAARTPWLTGLWKGRQVADALGMPYPIYLSMAFDRVTRYWKQAFPPQPGHVNPQNEGDVAELAEKWTAHQAANLIHGTHPLFHNDNYTGAPAQNAHHEWLFEQMMLRENPAPILAQLVYSKGLLPSQKVRSRLGDEMSEQILTFL